MYLRSPPVGSWPSYTQGPPPSCPPPPQPRRPRPLPPNQPTTYRRVLALHAHGRLVEHYPALAAEVKRFNAALRRAVRLAADCVHMPSEHRRGHRAAREEHIGEGLPLVAGGMGEEAGFGLGETKGHIWVSGQHTLRRIPGSAEGWRSHSTGTGVDAPSH